MEQTSGENIQANKKKNLTSYHLKIIAIITMLIDHLGAGIYEKKMTFYEIDFHDFWSVYNLPLLGDFIIRGIGRIAFPLFCFMIVEGLYYTRNKWKYLARLVAFCFISEIPFDICFYHELFYWDYQNVYFTLSLGLLAIILFQIVEQNIKPIWLKYGMAVLPVAACCFAAELLKTDYGALGVGLIVVFYILRGYPKLRNIGMLIMLALIGNIEVLGIVDIVFLKKYNGEKGKNIPKYFFYLFYPVHLLLIAGVFYLIWGF